MQNIVEFSHQGYTARYKYVEGVNKPTLIFLMGSLQEIESVEVFNRAFSVDYNYYAIELPGSGNTKPLHPRHSVEFQTEFLSRMVDELCIQELHLVACSYATAVALEFAKQSDKLRRLVLAGSMMDIPMDEWPTILQLMRDSAFDKKSFANGFIDILTEKEGKIPRKDVIRKAAVRKAARYRADNFWHFVFNTIRLMCYEPNDLHLINVPTLVFTGEYDPYVKPERAQALANSIRTAQFTLVRGCDHLFHIEDPEQTISLILGFLEGAESNLAA